MVPWALHILTNHMNSRSCNIDDSWSLNPFGFTVAGTPFCVVRLLDNKPYMVGRPYMAKICCARLGKGFYDGMPWTGFRMFFLVNVQVILKKSALEKRL